MEPIQLLTWREEYESGIDIIDQQHKNIIKALNDIYVAFSEGQKIEEKIPNLLKAFDNYATVHHKTEESYAEKYGFPKTEELKESHKFFMASYEQLKFLYNQTNEQSLPKIQYILHLHTVMSEWLMYHFATLDKELFEYLKGRFQG